MELNINLPEGDYHFKKHIFRFKPYRTDGLILQVHHSYTDSGGDQKKYRFIHSSFNEIGAQLALADHKGFIFIIDLQTEKYWQLPCAGISTVVAFNPKKKQDLLVGLDNTTCVYIHIETGIVTGIFEGHLSPATDASFSDDGFYCLSSNSTEAIIWNLSTFVQIHRLSLKDDVSLKKVMFMPVTNHILACFQDDSIHIWKFKTLECVKQIIPETSRTHHLKAIALTKNGRAMVIGGHTPNLVVFCLDTWAITKVVEFPEHVSGVKQMDFISQGFDGGANKILIILSNSLEIYFFDIETSVFLNGLYQTFGSTASSKVIKLANDNHSANDFQMLQHKLFFVKFSLSGNGKYLATTLTTGEVNIYMVDKVLSMKKSNPDMERNLSSNKTSPNFSPFKQFSGRSSRRTQKSYESLSSVQQEIKNTLDIKKLLPILKHYGEYPDTYRSLIWKMILDVPSNQQSFMSLSLKKCHSSYTRLENKYPLVNKSLRDSLKKLLSNLAYWCPLFGEVDFLPEFVFPFLKVFHSDPLACFEVTATIIVNWCQNWFEFYPFPPINMLSMMESILGHHDPDLLEFYLQNNLTSSVIFCPIFHTVFSEVLSKSEWLRLWDHILSNEPSFLFMAIIAYNVVCKNAIKSFKSTEEIMKFFHKQNPVDMKKFLSKTYSFLKNTPNDIHPRQFFSPFRPLSAGGTYTSFFSYPKLIVDPSADKLQTIRMEEEEILAEQLKAIRIKNELDQKLRSEFGDNNKQEKMYRALEEKIRKTVDEEEERMLSQRKKLQNLRQELRMKELEVLEDTREKVLEQRLNKKRLEFERLLREISKRKAREKMEVDLIEEEIRKYYSELLLKKCQLELELGFREDEGVVGSCLEKERSNLKNELTELQNELSSMHHDKRIGISNKMATIKALVQDLETEVAKEVSEKLCEQESLDNKEFVVQLKKKVNILEDDVERLIKENLNHLQQKKSDKKTVTLFQPPRSKPPSHREKCKHEKTKPIFCQNKKSKNLKKPKFKKVVRTVTSDGSTRITTICTKIPKITPKTSEDENESIKNSFQAYKHDTESELKSEIEVSKNRKHPLRSKFTCPTQSHEICPDLKCKTVGCCIQLINPKDDVTRLHLLGDFAKRENLGSKTKFKANLSSDNFEKFSCCRGDEDHTTDFQNEIFRSAFKTRRRLIEKARISEESG